MSIKINKRVLKNNWYEIEETSICPHCSQSVFSEMVSSSFFEFQKDYNFVVITYKCPDPECSRIYISLYLSHNADKKLELLYIYPTKLPKILDPLLQEMSPRFIESYRQANIAENHNCFDLAGSGYRNAIEILIKDYAIIELKEDPTTVAKKKLHICIKEYLGDVDLTRCADVVRILGNDNTHYERKYEELDFNILKTYMDIFIQLITTKLRINHPPVGNH